jgi:protein TonB
MRIQPVVILALLAAASMNAAAFKPRIAVLTPEKTEFSVRYAQSLERSLESGFRVLDHDLAASAYASLKIDSPFNQTLETAKSIGAVLGSDRFVLVRTETSRRSSSARPTYFEASAFIFLVDARSGRLEKFLLAAKQSDTAVEAENALVNDTEAAAAILAFALTFQSPVADVDYEKFDPDSKTMRPAMPYRRIKPAYTDIAFLYDIKATVDAEVSVDEKGTVRRIDILRWAGFGLDESAIEAVNKMNWRPGERNGKPLAMRVLLRYNFTKIEKEQ